MQLNQRLRSSGILGDELRLNESTHMESTGNICWQECKAFAETVSICSNTKSMELRNLFLTIICYAIIFTFAEITYGMSSILLKGAAVAILKRSEGDVGLQLVYHSVGALMLAPTAGLLIDFFSERNGKQDYIPLFVFYLGTRVASFMIMCCCVDLEFKPTSNTLLRDLKDLFMQPKMAAFLAFILASGSIYGFLQTFLFWLLEDFGASESLMGVTVMVGAAFGIPFSMLASYFTQKLGHANTLVFCFSIYVIRLLGYSLLRNPWLSLPFDALDACTFYLLHVATVSYAGVLSSPTTVVSLQSVSASLYFGIGKGGGALVGGVLMQSLGAVWTFRLLAGFCGAVAALYFALNQLVFAAQEELRPRAVHGWSNLVSSGADKPPNYSSM